MLLTPIETPQHLKQTGTLLLPVTATAALGPASYIAGLGAFTVGSLLYPDTANTVAQLLAVVVNQVLVSGGVATAPAWSSTPTLAGITCTAINPLTTPAESWIGPSSTTGIYFKSGNVGIGTASPGYKLEVAGTGAIARFGNDTAATSYIKIAGARSIFGYNDATANAVIQGSVSKGIEFNVNNNTFGSGTAMTILSGGNVGIGTTNPGANLDVYSRIKIFSNDPMLWFHDNVDTNHFKFIGGWDGNILIGSGNASFATTATYIAINNSGNVGIGTTSPGYKLDVSGNIRVASGTDVYIQRSQYGYSSSYEAVQLGYLAGIGDSVSIALGIDPNTIAGGAFSGNEIALPNTVEFMQANSGLTDWLQDVLVLKNSNVGIGYADPGTGKLSINGNVGIGTTSPETRLQIGNYSSTEALTLAMSQNTEGRINFYDVDSTQGGSIRVVGGAGGSTMYFANRWDADSNKVTFDLMSGNVGIGTASPGYKLEVAGTGAIARFGNDTAATSYIKIAGARSIFGYNDATANAVIQGSVSKGIEFNVNNNTFGSGTAMTILSGGNVGIGTTSPGAVLEVKGTSTVGGGASTIIINGTYAAGSSGYPGISFQSNGTNQGLIRSVPGNGLSLFSGITESVRVTTNGGLSVGNGYVATDPGAGSMIISGNVGIGTTAPTNILSLGGNAARIFWMERHTTANTAGNSLTVQAGGATSGATDKAGGDLLLKPGRSTGTGESGLQLQGCVAGGAGTGDNSFATILQILGNKLALFGATPVAQQLKANHNNWAAVSDVVSALVNLGLFDQN